MDIRNKIKFEKLLRKKDIRLDKFINNVLYNNGYYNNYKPLGRNNDFITAPEISQMFGEIIGLYLFYNWDKYINSKFNFIELGPGNGTLFKDIINTVSNYPNFLKKAKVEFIEINKELIKRQKKNIGDLNNKYIKWRKSINFKSRYPSIIYSNEFFDCFSVN